MQYLKEQFKLLWERSSCVGDWKIFFQELRTNYAKPKRYYHTFDGHIEFCVKAFFEHAQGRVNNPDGVLWQLFLHDVVMDFERSDNDAKGAEYARLFLTRAQASARLVNYVGQAIECHTHQYIPDDDNIAFGLDIDLFILAQAQEIFDQYELNVKQEYSFVEENFRRQRRAKILTSFLEERPSIFITRYFRDNFEVVARQRLKNSIRKLGRK
jgi:predicted metal-dependent HD superfamily phosphohydrolase